MIMNSVLKSLGLMVANVDNCPIELTGIRLSKCYDSKDGILSNLFKTKFFKFQ